MRLGRALITPANSSPARVGPRARMCTGDTSVCGAIGDSRWRNVITDTPGLMCVCVPGRVRQVFVKNSYPLLSGSITLTARLDSALLQQELFSGLDEARDFHSSCQRLFIIYMLLMGTVFNTSGPW